MKEIYKNINQLLLSLPRNAVVTSSGLAENGISYRLQHYYQNKKTLESIGVGAYVLTSFKQQVGVVGALYALQNQLHLNIYIGA